MYSYGPPHMAVQKQDDQHEHTSSSYVRIQDVVLKTYLGRWTIGRSGERGSGISVLPARYDDDDLSTSFHLLFWLLSKVLISEFSILFPRNFNFTLLGNYIWLLNFLVNPSRTAIDQYCHIGIMSHIIISMKFLITLQGDQVTWLIYEGHSINNGVFFFWETYYSYESHSINLGRVFWLKKDSLQYARGKLSSKLCKSINNTDISFYQIYLPKLHENILKYYWINLFKKLTLASTSTSRQLPNLLKAFSIFSLFKLINTAIILTFTSFLWLHWFLLVSCSTPHHT